MSAEAVQDRRRACPWLVRAVLVLTDAIGFTLALSIATVMRIWLGGSIDLVAYVSVWPVILVFTAVAALYRLYSTLPQHPAEELRRYVAVVLMVFLVMAALTFLRRDATDWSRGAFLMALPLAVLLVPMMRALVRGTLGRCGWWSHPFLILGAGHTARALVTAMKANPSGGMRPVAILDDADDRPVEIDGVPVVGSLADAREVAAVHGIKHAVFAMPGVSADRLRAIESEAGDAVPNIFLVPNFAGYAALWTTPRDLGAGIMGIEVQHRLLLRGPTTWKRCQDLALAVLVSLVTLPLMAVIGLILLVSSGRPVCFGHDRLGRGGSTFTAWKFRTMVKDADAVLERYLVEHPELREEWDRDQKLRDDPRVTWFGRLLRKTSLDELPQLWNVFRGDMALVGPRPIVEAEVERYGPAWPLYQRVLPGVTGIWQISGRNDTTYAERIALDTFYVRNWSPWLDCWILIRTVRVVLCGKGAY